MEQSINSDLIRGHIDTIILKSLIDGDKFPQEISDYVYKVSNESYSINQATLYSSLKRLESTKLLRSYWQDSTNGRRKFFALTQSGRDCIEKKVSEWSHSREIIDVLMGIPAQKTVIFSQTAPQVAQKPIITEKTPEISVVESKTINNKPIFEEKIEKKVENLQKPEDNEVKDINYKGILGNLLSSTVIKKENTVITPIIDNSDNKTIDEKIDEIAKPIDKTKFNEMIDTTKYSGNTINNNLKIDFGDLEINAASEGYKLRISSKDSARRKEGVLINKINAISSWIAFIIFAISTFIVASVNNSSPLIYLYMLIGFLPIYYTVKLLSNSKKVVVNKINKDSILISLVVIFNLILITCALNFFFDVNMFDTKQITATLILPNISFLCGLIFTITRYVLSNKSKFNYSVN